ncbi:MAG: V-type ATP synthase subunit E [Oscillospiraceae bacterium]|nr:V-type ATP synthase subunit E [Oscillospiraceae bacterium]
MEKLSGFYSAINHYAEAQREKIMKDIEAYKIKDLREAETTAKIEADRLIKKEVAEARSNIVREMSHKEIDARRVLLEKRQKIENCVFEKAAEALVEFTKTPAYAKTLQKNAAEMAKVLTKPGTVVYVKTGDGKAKDVAVAAFGGKVTVEEDDRIKIGGFRGENAEMRILLDATLDAMLDEQHSWFEENSGMAVV